MDPDKFNNPWLVSNLDEFLFYNCPECDSKSPTKAIFINHALVEHPRARDAIPSIEVNDILPIEDDIKDEPKPNDEDDKAKDPEEVQCYYCCQF